MNPLLQLQNIITHPRLLNNLLFFLLLIVCSFQTHSETIEAKVESDNPKSLKGGTPDEITNTETNENSEDNNQVTKTNLFEINEVLIQKKPKKKSTSFYEDFKQQQEEALERTQKTVDLNQENVSQRLHRFSSYVDKFFADESYVQESKDSRMRISIANQYQKYADPTFQPRMSLLLALPNTQNRWRIRFQSDDELESEDKNSDTNLIDSVENTTYSTAVSRILRATDLVDIRADAGIKFRTPIDPFTKLRIRRSFLFAKTELRLTETFQWRDSEGKTAASGLDIEYPFTLKYFFRSSTEGIYWDINSYWTGSQSFTIYEQIDSKTIIAYAIGTHVQNEDEFHLRKKDQVNDYWVELRYRKNFYKDWLFYQVSPGLIRPREYEFETLPRLELKLEALYGRL